MGLSKKFLLLIVILIIIGLEMGIFISRQPYVNLASSAILKIFVNDPFKLPQECLDKADGYNTSWTCFRTYFKTLTSKISVRAAMAEAIKIEKQGIVSDCHLFSHYIGEEHLEKSDFNMGKAFSSCPVGCRNGCFHGVLQRYISNEADPYEVISEAKNICNTLGTDELNKHRCIHGIGHGLFAHDYLSLQDAMNVCDTFKELDEKRWRDACIGGVVMEQMDQYLRLDLDENHLKEILPEICVLPGELPEDLVFIHPCLYDLALGLLYYTGWDAEPAKELCEGLQRQDYVSHCKQIILIQIFDQRPSNIDMIKFLEEERIYHPFIQ